MKFNVFLIKSEFKTIKSFLKDKVRYEESDFKPILGLSGKIIIGKEKETKPAWRIFVESASSTSIRQLSNKSSRGLVIIEVQNRFLVYSFGYGRFLLRSTCIQKDFGFKTALNLIKPEKIKVIDITNFDEMSMHSRKQLNRSADVETFGIDVFRDLMRAVTGQPESPEFGKVISGFDGFGFSSKMNSDKLKERSLALLNAYKSQKYKTHFEWVDNLHQVRDKTVIDQLNGDLCDKIKTNNFTKMLIAPPSIIEWQTIDNFKYSSRSAEYTELDIADLVSSIKNLGKVDSDYLKRKHILVKYVDTDEYGDLWSFYDSITFETLIGGKTYVLVIGTWFEIETKFADRVKNYVRNIPNCQIQFSNYPKGIREEDYVEQFVQANSNDYVPPCLRVVVA